jgi:hypothetical protein
MQRLWILPLIFARVMGSGTYPPVVASARLVTKLIKRSRLAMVKFL